MSLILILLGIVDDCAERKGGKFRVEFLDRRELLQNPSSRDSSLEPLGFERGVGVCLSSTLTRHSYELVPCL